MSRQLILCVESNSTARTDYAYIESIIKHFYVDDKKTKLSPFFLGSKGMYNASGNVKKINKMIKQFLGETTVIYFIDTDDYDTSADVKVLNDAIEKYCSDNGYEFVFFCKDIEDVFLNRRVSKSEKVNCAAEFKRKGLIETVNEEKLRFTKPVRHYSNILMVLDKYLNTE